jgi:hypothetical protein
MEDPAVRGGQKGGQASLHSSKVSAAQLQVYLKGIDYPVNKQKLIEKAKTNMAPENVMSFLNRLPERQYNYPTDVEEEFGKMK